MCNQSPTRTCRPLRQEQGGQAPSVGVTVGGSAEVAREWVGGQSPLPELDKHAADPHHKWRGYGRTAGVENDCELGFSILLLQRLRKCSQGRGVGGG
mmetsp:Transcript_42994/g.77240  ORF Transcript_42994/g.77240 Transcript_42994/m.77240 type:complete len:97 (+) Transcript_42994:173-463(+)